MTTWQRSACAVLVAAGTTACAYPKTEALKQWSLAKGYRFTRTDAPGFDPNKPIDARRAAVKKADRLFVVLAFSGGGTRAGALSYGVLRQLEAVRIHVDDNGDVVECKEWDSDACKKMERRLLDEVDVISSVSGGSFTAAYYGLNGKEIFKEDSAFHRKFLFHDLQRDLFGNAVYHPRSWLRLGSRVEIAARLYEKELFGPATFATLAARPRPFVILNADDMATGNRFEFTQDQFDLLCADLAPFPVARAVTASSAFPGLLNSMTIDSHNGSDAKKSPCGYAGPGSDDADDNWVKDAVEDKAASRRRYRAAQAIQAYRETARRHLHLLDGGLADNVGLRTVIQSLFLVDRPTAPAGASDADELNADEGRLVGGWSLRAAISDKRVQTLIVIGVNARTAHTKTWDRKKRGPGTFAVLSATRGTPMGNFSHESVDGIQIETTALAKEFKKSTRRVFSFEVAFDDLDNEDERAYFLNLPTNFGLTRKDTTCLVDAGATLLRDSLVLSWIDPDNPVPTFAETVRTGLFGRIEPPPLMGTPAECRARK
jgi:NTE family protein